MTPDTTHAPMTLEETKRGLETLACFFGGDEPGDRDLCLSALHHLETAKRDSERLDWLEKNRKGVYTMTHPISSGPNSEFHFDGWAVGNSVEARELLRPAIDAAMSTEKEEGGS